MRPDRPGLFSRTREGVVGTPDTTPGRLVGMTGRLGPGVFGDNWFGQSVQGYTNAWGNATDEAYGALRHPVTTAKRVAGKAKDVAKAIIPGW